MVLYSWSGGVFNFVVFLLLPSKIDGNPNQQRKYNSCSQTAYKQRIICSDTETQKSRQVCTVTAKLIFNYQSTTDGTGLCDESGAFNGHYNVS